MRRTLIVGTLVGAVVMVAAPASATPPEVTPASCDGPGQTFSVERGVRSCTTVTTLVQESRQYSIGQYTAVPDGTWQHHVGIADMTYTWEQIYTQSQHGNDRVTEDFDFVLLSTDVDPVACEFWTRNRSYNVIDRSQRPLAECESQGLFDPA